MKYPEQVRPGDIRQYQAEKSIPSLFIIILFLMRSFVNRKSWKSGDAVAALDLFREALMNSRCLPLFLADVRFLS